MSVCPRCERPAPEGARFCPACGSRLAAAEGGRFASPGAYTPPHLARRILDARAAVEGERKQVTVLFADIHGLDRRMGDRDPEEVGPLVDRVRELMMEAVHRYEGTVNQVVGDGIMALFGAPLAHEDHAVRACYAALRMQAQVSAYGDEVQRSLGLPLLIRVGLNSGEVVARSIGPTSPSPTPRWGRPCTWPRAWSRWPSPPPSSPPTRPWPSCAAGCGEAAGAGAGAGLQSRWGARDHRRGADPLAP